MATMENSKNKQSLLILILGCLTALSPFSIDMYLSAFPLMAKALNTTVSQVSMTLSSYFVGLASGQLFYGPLMDRFGRKKPLAAGLSIYILASIGCLLSPTVEALVVLRFIQALGGCAASVAAFSMVRDLFTPTESAKVLSLLILILGVSPLLAPTIGGFLSIHFGWTSVFMALTAGSTTLLIVSMKFLPETHKGDSSHVLRAGPIARNYWSIVQNKSFLTYAVSGAIAFSGLFVYLAASPIIFMDVFKVSEQVYGWIFAFIAMGLVGMSQMNVVLLKKFRNAQIMGGALIMIMLISLFFFVSAYNEWATMITVVLTMFLLLSCFGLSNPNAQALAMEPFGKNAGSAAAMIGFVQMGIGALASVCVGLLKAQQLLPISAIFVITSLLAAIVFFVGNSVIRKAKLS